jgi:hypothetical protein
MLEQLQLAVCALRQDRSAEGLHNLLDGDGLASKLVLGRAVRRSVCASLLRHANVPDEAKGSHAHGLQVSVPMRRQSHLRANVGYGRRTCL